MTVKKKDRTLWVTVWKKSVELHYGVKMPTEVVLVLGRLHMVDRKDFVRWSGLNLKPGTYGLTVRLAVVEKLRKVITTVVTERKRQTLERR